MDFRELPAPTDEEVTRVASETCRRTRDILVKRGLWAVAFEPMDFLAKLVALVPRLGTNILRFHGVYAPNARLRCQVLPTREEAGRRPCQCGPGAPSPETNRLCWAEWLQRTRNLDVFACPRCNSKMVRITWITTADAMRKILTSVGLAADSPMAAPARSAQELFGQTNPVSGAAVAPDRRSHSQIRCP